MNNKYANVLFSDDVIFLNAIYENYANNVLTEEQAIHMLSMVESLYDNIENIRNYYMERGEFIGFPAVPVPITGTMIPSIHVVEETVLGDTMFGNAYRLHTNPEWITESGVVESKLNGLYEEMHKDIQDINLKGMYHNTRYLWVAQESTLENSGFRLIEMIPLYCEYYCLANNIPLEDASIINGFFEGVYNEFNVGAMSPIIPLTGTEEPEEKEDDGMEDTNDESEEDAELLSKFENAEQYTEYVREYFMESGITAFYEGGVPRNYVPFDTEARKLWDKVKDCVEGYGDNAKFTGSLNVKKNKYNFKCKPDAKEDDVNNAINALGYTPNRENNRIINWSKKVSNMNLEVTFDGPESGISISYQLETAESVDSNLTAYENTFMENDNDYATDVPEVHEILESVLDAVEFDYTDAVSRIQEAENNLIELSQAGDTINIYSGKGLELWRSYEAAYNDAVNDFEALLEMGNHIPSEVPKFRIYEASSEEIRNNPKIDEGIKDILVKLNKLGYKTKYSCTGHSPTRLGRDGKKDGVYHGKLYTTARINFDKVYDFATLPDNWYQSNDGDVTSIYVKPCNYDKKDGSVDTAFDNWKKRYMNALDKWVDELPPAGKSLDENENISESALYDLERTFLESCIH